MFSLMDVKSNKNTSTEKHEMSLIPKHFVGRNPAITTWDE